MRKDQARAMSPKCHSRPMHSVRVPINVRCYSWLCKNSTRYNRTRNFGLYGHAESKKTQKFVFRSALRPNQISFSHGQTRIATLFFGAAKCREGPISDFRPQRSETCVENVGTFWATLVQSNYPKCSISNSVRTRTFRAGWCPGGRTMERPASGSG